MTNIQSENVKHLYDVLYLRDCVHPICIKVNLYTKTQGSKIVIKYMKDMEKISIKYLTANPTRTAVR